MRTWLFIPAAVLATIIRVDAAGAQDQPCGDVVLSADLPTTVEIMGASPKQDDFDCFAWKSFVALNWPAAAGEPDRSKPLGELGHGGDVVWTTYKAPHEVFLPNGANPCPMCPAGSPTPACLEQCWATAREPPKICGSLAEGDGSPPRALAMTSKVGSFATGLFQAVPNVWLTDRHGELARYEIRLNRDEFDYIVGNRYYDGRVQKRIWQDNRQFMFTLPSGDESGVVGAIELKAAWRIFSDDAPAADKQRFLTMPGLIVDTAVDLRTGYPDPLNGQYPTCNLAGEGPCCIRDMGLVGFHIARKVAPFWQWVWATFEHVDNVPVQDQPIDPATTYTFFDPDCPDGEPRCAINTNPRELALAHPDDPSLGVRNPTRVERVIPEVGGQPEPLLPAAINRQWHDLVAGTPFANYVLVSTQWPTNPGAQNPSGPFNSGQPSPTYLANTTLETYNQVVPSNPALNASCIGCHIVGVSIAGQFADFSFLLNRAKPRLYD